MGRAAAEEADKGALVRVCPPRSWGGGSAGRARRLWLGSAAGFAVGSALAHGGWRRATAALRL